MGELIRIAEYLQEKHYASYCWLFERTRFCPTYSYGYLESLEDSHGYTIIE